MDGLLDQLLLATRCHPFAQKQIVCVPRSGRFSIASARPFSIQPPPISSSPCGARPKTTKRRSWQSPIRAELVAYLLLLLTVTDTTTATTTTMRRGLAVFLIINALIVAFLVRSVFTLLTLLIEDGSADAIHSAEIPAPNSPLIENLPQIIPKIIHQTYVNDTIPEHWREAQRSCIDLHEDYEYKVGARFPPLIGGNGGDRAEPITNQENRFGLALDRRQVTRTDCHRISLVFEHL